MFNYFSLLAGPPHSKVSVILIVSDLASFEGDIKKSRHREMKAAWILDCLWVKRPLNNFWNFVNIWTSYTFPNFSLILWSWKKTPFHFFLFFKVFLLFLPHQTAILPISEYAFSHGILFLPLSVSSWWKLLKLKSCLNQLILHHNLVLVIVYKNPWSILLKTF